MIAAPARPGAHPSRRADRGLVLHTLGLDYLNNRHHDPTLGQFISVDPLVTMTGEPYIYGSANPIAYSDPTGLFSSCTLSDGELTCAADPDSLVADVNGQGHYQYLSGFVSGKVTGYDVVNRNAQGPISSPGSGAGFFSFLAGFVPFADCHHMATTPGNQYGSAVGCGIDIGTLGIASKAKPVTGLADDAAEGALRWLDDLFGGTKALCSFSAETEVLMADGSTKPISQVEIGDWVLAENPETGERGAREVTHLWVHDDMLLELKIDGDVVVTTEDHPFWNATDGRWQHARDFDVGDRVLAADGGLLEVAGLDWSTTFEGTAYNLTVDDIHTYYVEVGDNQVLVHNTGCDDLVGAAADFDADELAQMAFRHAGDGDIPGRPTLSPIERALRTEGTRIRDDAVKFVDGDVVVIINESVPTRSTAYLRD